MPIGGIQRRLILKDIVVTTITKNIIITEAHNGMKYRTYAKL